MTMTANSVLGDQKVVAFLATTDGARAVQFYGRSLGLRLRYDDDFAVVFEAGNVELRIQKVERFAPQPFTVLGWQVPDIGTVVSALVSSGAQVERYPWLEQDESGVWLAPSGARVVWFKDPDGNLLSVAQYPAG